MFISVPFTAGQRLEYREAGDFFRLVGDSANSTFTVEFYLREQRVSDAPGVVAGYFEKFDGEGFDKIAITATVATTAVFVTRLGNQVGYDLPPTGNVSIQSGAFTQVQKTVTNASAQMVAANPSRRYLMIQNKDAAGNIFLRVDGAAATVANGLQQGPGDSLEYSSRCPTGAIFAIGDIASNTSVIVVEG